MKLIICGNGFDLHHGFKTGYHHYKNFLEVHYPQAIRDFEDLKNESIFNSIEIRKNQLDDFFKNNCFPYEAGNKEEIMSYANFAASAQNALELVILDLVKELKEKTSCKLCFFIYIYTL